jgi:hypothetical protein
MQKNPETSFQCINIQCLECFFFNIRLHRFTYIADTRGEPNEQQDFITKAEIEMEIEM